MKNDIMPIIQELCEQAGDLPPTGNGLIDARYEAHNTNYGHYWPYYRVFYYLAKSLPAGSVVLELGGYQGTAAAHFKAGNPDMKVMTIDHHTDPGDEQNMAKMHEVVEALGIIYLRGWTTVQLAEQQKGQHALGDAPPVYEDVLHYLAGDKITVLFIDSWHHYEHAMNDWLVYSPLLASPSLVICDDITGASSVTISGMFDFWNELQGLEKFLNFQIHPGTGMGFMIYEPNHF